MSAVSGTKAESEGKRLSSGTGESGGTGGEAERTSPPKEGVEATNEIQGSGDLDLLVLDDGESYEGYRDSEDDAAEDDEEGHEEGEGNLEAEIDEDELEGDEESSEARALHRLDLEYNKIRPVYAEKFRPGDVLVVIQDVIREIIADKTYIETEVQGWISEMCKLINDRVKEMNFPRYKLITHVTIGEFRGQGVIAATKCVWDITSDYFSTYSFSNDSLFCNALVYGIYFY